MNQWFKIWTQKKMRTYDVVHHMVVYICVYLKKNNGIIKLFSLLFNDLKYGQRKKNSTCDLFIVVKMAWIK